MKLSRDISHELVKELILIVGAPGAQQILSVDPTRFKFLANGHGCVSFEQLAKIELRTGRAWQRWLVDAGGRYSKTPQARAFVARAHAMWDEILGPEKKSPVRSPRRATAASFRNAV